MGWSDIPTRPAPWGRLSGGSRTTAVWVRGEEGGGTSFQIVTTTGQRREQVYVPVSAFGDGWDAVALVVDGFGLGDTKASRSIFSLGQSVSTSAADCQPVGAVCSEVEVDWFRILDRSLVGTLGGLGGKGLSFATIFDWVSRWWKDSGKVDVRPVVLLSGRIMRGWHQGGVNWAHLPDISKWLEQAGRDYVKYIQLVSWLLMISLGLYSLSLFRTKKYFVMVIAFLFLVPAMLVLRHILKYQDSAFAASSHGATSMAQIIYAVLGILTCGAVFALPWLIPVQNPKIFSTHDVCWSNNFLADVRRKFLLVGFRDCAYVIGWAYMLCWCLLQLLLQQPINSMPILLLLVQILASVCYCSNSGLHLKQWVEVAALFYLGMAGHFALGNTNTLASIDVAGAFIGISSHSTLLSGILMFIITYASPLLAFLSMVMYMSMKQTSYLVNPQDADIGHFLKMTVGFPCLVPLGLNSVLLFAYTIVLLLMRNHLFVWSVFSPKYLYVCATTVCVYIGVSVVYSTAIYTSLVFALRSRTLQCSIRDESRVSMVRQ